MQITGPGPNAGQHQPVAPVVSFIEVNPELKRKRELHELAERRAAEMRAMIDPKGPNRSNRFLDFRELGEAITDRLHRAFKGRVPEVGDDLLTGIPATTLREKILEVIGLFPEGVPIIAGEVLSALLTGTAVAPNEERDIAAQQLAERMQRGKQPFSMQPMWKADP